MKFDINLIEGSGPIDASVSSILIDRLGIKENEDAAFLTLSSREENKLTMVAFDNIKSVTLDKEKEIKFDHTKPVEVLVNEFVEIYKKFDSQMINVTFTNIDNNSGTKKVLVPRRTTYLEAIKLITLEPVEGKVPVFQFSSTPIDETNNDQILKDISIDVVWNTAKHIVYFMNYNNIGGDKKVEVDHDSTVGAAITKASLTNDGLEATYTLNGEVVTAGTGTLIKTSIDIICTWKPILDPKSVKKTKVAETLNTKNETLDNDPEIVKETLDDSQVAMEEEKTLEQASVMNETENHTVEEASAETPTTAKPTKTTSKKATSTKKA